jgi:hypothetical protein
LLSVNTLVVKPSYVPRQGGDMTRMTLAVVLVAVAASGCATSYGARGDSGGGFKDVQVDANTFRVSFLGNGFTKKDDVQTFTTYRCAELTLQKGFDYYIVVNTDNSATTAYVNQSYGSGVVGSTPVTSHTGAVTIKLFKGEKPKDDPNAYAAREVVKYLGPTVDPTGYQTLLKQQS